MRFISAKTNIPISKLYCSFEDSDAVYIVMEYVDGVTMNTLDPEKRKVVEKQIEQHLETLRQLKSDTFGGPSGIVISPYRAMVKSARMEWKMKRRPTKDLVFCHNALSTYNVIVDPETLLIKVIIDWEYAGFFPPEFEGMFFRRNGPSVALEGEENDVGRLLDIMYENEEVRH
ncbi:hypothetical protein VTK56DRAFT_4262 [Thermocarpiscus australiensis]